MVWTLPRVLVVNLTAISPCKSQSTIVSHLVPLARHKPLNPLPRIYRLLNPIKRKQVNRVSRDVGNFVLGGKSQDPSSKLCGRLDLLGSD